MLMFRDFVLANCGGRHGNTVRACVDRPSGHSSGRAWDWMVNASDEQEKAAADGLIAWLLANDAELFRRAGLTYLIWDRRSWSAVGKGWHPYDGFDEAGRCPSGSCRNPHLDHVHFSFSKEGADGKTSFYDWLRVGSPQLVPAPSPRPTAKASVGAGAAIGFVLGVAAVLATRRAYRRAT